MNDFTTVFETLKGLLPMQYFENMVRVIAGGLWNSFMVLKETLKPTRQKSTRRRFNWKKTYKKLILQYRIEHIAFTA